VTGPHICGACGQCAVTVERDSEEVRVVCSACNTKRVHVPVWATADDRVLAMVIGRPPVKRGKPRKRSGGNIASVTGGVRL